jgi:hypothetical protein
VEGIGGRFGLPPAYVRNQQICWVELAAGKAELFSARVELPGATKMERFVARGRNPHSDTPVRVASWPDGPDWPPADSKAEPKQPVQCDPRGQADAQGSRGPRGPGCLYGPRDPEGPAEA